MFFSLIRLLTLVCTALAVERTLFVYDAENVPLTGAPEYFKQLVGRFKGEGQDLVLRGYQDNDLLLKMPDQPLFDTVVLLPTVSKKVTNKQHFNKHILLELLDANVNLVVVGNSTTNYPDDVREVLAELGIFPSPKGYKLVDHFEDNGLVKLGRKNIVAPKVVSAIDAEYEGQAALLNNNELLVPLVRGSKTSVSTNSGVDAVDATNYWGVGQQNFVAAGLQSLHGGRVAWVGDLALLTDEIVAWATQKKNVLKLQFVQHHKKDEPSKLDPELYRIKDEVTYTVGVSELKDGQWQPYVAEGDDALQLAFKMLDPYIRVNLQPLGPAAASDNGPEDTYVYSTSFTVPDHHGMFTFELDYKRAGLNFLQDKRVVAVRHLANDEFKRSWEITNSWFYVVSAVLVAVGWFLFVVNFLYVSNTNQAKKQQ